MCHVAINGGFKLQKETYMKLVLLYTVLVSMYGSEEIVGECVIYKNTSATTCIVNGEDAKGVIDRNGLISAYSSDKSYVLKPRGSANYPETENPFSS